MVIVGAQDRLATQRVYLDICVSEDVNAQIPEYDVNIEV